MWSLTTTASFLQETRQRLYFLALLRIAYRYYDVRVESTYGTYISMLLDRSTNDVFGLLQKAPYGLHVPIAVTRNRFTIVACGRRNLPNKEYS